MNRNSSGVKLMSIAFALAIACPAFLAPANTTVIPGCNVVQRKTNCERVIFSHSLSEQWCPKTFLFGANRTVETNRYDDRFS